MEKVLRIKEELSGHRGILTESEYNSRMVKWGGSVRKSAASAAAMHTKGKKTATHVYKSGPKAGKKETRLSTHVNFEIKSRGGEVSGVVFKFPRHGIFLEYGVSRGHRANGIRRSMSDWMSAALNKKEGELEEIVVTYQSDKVVRTYLGIKK